MLRNLNDLRNFAIRASDGDIGHIKDFYFDDHKWVLRYFVVDTGQWLAGRKVLISPIAIGHVNFPDRVITASITRDQVKSSPSIDTDKPVSRQYEMEYLGYYDYPYYWGGAGLWGGVGYPGMMMTNVGFDGRDAAERQLRAEQAHERNLASKHDDPHLRSCNTVVGYHLHAQDGEIGHVQGILVDEESWAIRYFIVETSNWWLGNKVLVAPESISDVSWPDSTITVDLTREAIKTALPYDQQVPLASTQPPSRQAQPLQPSAIV